jgi:hypothetical protein
MAWLVTALVARLLWGGYRAREDNYTVLFLFYFVPLLILTGYLWWSSQKRKLFHLSALYWHFLSFIVLINTLIIKYPLQSYGDRNQLNELLSTNTVFPRYLVGSRFLLTVFQIARLVFSTKSSITGILDPDTFVRVFGSMLMLTLSLVLLRRNSTRLSIVLPITLPVWFLFSSGYNEYYPFIIPVFVICLLFLDYWDISRLHPILVGLITALAALVYAAFIPLALFLLGLYFLRGGVKRGLVALVFALFWALALISICWPGSFSSFIQQYVYTLNLGDINSTEIFLGQAFGMTPFFKPDYAFSVDHLKMIFFMLFWVGGISSAILLIVMTVLLAIKGELKQKKFIIPGLFLLYQITYFFFMIPKLGPLKDVDLFFSVYLTIAFTAGLLTDHYVKSLPEKKSRWYSFICYALVAGNTAFCVYHLLLWGIPLRY